MSKPKSSRSEKIEAFGKLLDIMDILRAQCPWDSVQTTESLRPNTIEEVHELSEEILSAHPEGIKKELGDVLMHVVFYALIGQEDGDFDIKDVCDSICEKLIYRHPHIFGDTKVKDATEVEQNWEELKLKEKGGNKTIMGGVPKGLPPLIKAFRIQEKACNAGFDWDHREDVWNKVDEELQELKSEILTDKLEGEDDEMAIRRKEGELGDFVFSLINMARLYGLETDRALDRTNRKFINRFNYIEQKAKEQGKHLKDMTLAEMDKLWEEAKHL